LTGEKIMNMKNNIVFEARTSRNFLKYRSSLREIARKNRSFETEAEKVMWDVILRDKRMGYKFTRQKPIGRFVVDFYCSKLSLVVEIDDSSHDSKLERDKLRDKYLKQCGLTTIRYINSDVLTKTLFVESNLRKKIEQLSSHPCQGRG